MGNWFKESNLVNSPLPPSPDVDKNKLLQIFQDTTTSYKYLFFMALLEILKRDNFTSKIIPFDAIVRNMLAIAWYPYKYFKLSFGLVDKIPRELAKIDIELLSLSDSFAFPSHKEKLLKLLSTMIFTSSEIMRYVPYRLLQPFFTESIRGEKDGKKNAIIVNLAKEQFDEIRPFYSIDTTNSTIVMHPAWMEYLYENYELVETFAKWEWLCYMQRRNPSVPNLQSKLFPETYQPGMGMQSRFWKSVIQVESLQCIYSKQRITLDNFSLDHFIPWSFVAHNQLWNLIPVPLSVNSSKSNNLPSVQKYFDAYVDLQHQGLSIFHQLARSSEWKKTIEPYQVDIKIGINEILNKKRLKEQLRLTIDPLVTIASNMGFSRNWEYRG